MAVVTYNPDANDIIHKTSVDFTKNILSIPVRLMQYDDSLPIIAIELFKDDKPFHLPDIPNIFMSVSWGLNKNHSFIRKQVLGCNEDRNVVYIAVDEQMVIYDGTLNPALDLMITETQNNNEIKKIAGSTYFKVNIDRNPIQKTDIEAAYRIDKLIDVDMVHPNPTITGTEPIMNSIGIGNTNFVFPTGTPVFPNPDLTAPNIRQLDGLRIADNSFNVFNAEIKESEQAESVSIDSIVFIKI